MLVLLSWFNIQVAGIHANPVDRLDDDDINKVDRGRQSDMESVDQDPNLTPVLNDATTQHVRMQYIRTVIMYILLDIFYYMNLT